MLDRDAGYEVIEENAEGSAFVPPTPQEMRAQIDAARIVTKEMKAQMRRDAKMAKKAKKEQTSEIAVEEAPADEAPADEAPAVEEASVEAPATETAETKENE